MNGREDIVAVIVYEECINIPCEVTYKDILEYGQRLGVDPTGDQVLCAIIRGWISQPLPHYWFPCLDVVSQNWFYFNSLNGQSSWKHPLEDIHQTLVKEYVRKRNSRSSACCEQRSDSEVPERGVPEGESAEPSMESGSPKLPKTLLAPLGLSKNPVPRTLAPLRRIPKLNESVHVDQPSSLKADALSSQPNLFPSHQGARETSAGTKPLELFPNPSSVPKVDTSQFLDAISSPTSVRNTSSLPLSNSPSNQTAEPALLANSQKPLNFPIRSVQLKALQNPKTPSSESKELSQLSGDVPPRNSRNLSLSSNLSFTERLAAKKASRSKLSETKTTDVSRTSELTSATSIDKKRVQFSLGSRDIRNYTPECSDENNGVEDESCESVLHLLGDAQQLQAVDKRDMSTPKFEEKRWDVGLSSFGGASNNNSPAHKISLPPSSRSSGLIPIPDDDSAQSPVSELVTHFTSGLETRTFRISSNDNPLILATSSPILPDVDGDEKLKVQSNTFEPITSVHPPCDDVDKSVVSDSKKDHVFEENKKTLIPQLTDRTRELEPDPGSNEEVNASQDSLGMISSVPQSLKEATPVFSENQERSIFEVGLKEKAFFEAPFVSPSQCSSLVNNVVYLKSSDNCSLSSSTSNQDVADVASPSPIQPGQVEMPTNASILAPAIEINEPSIEASFQSNDVAYRTAMDEMLKMKREMETKLEKEKERLEQWFRDRIAQMKREFEQELVSERRLCNDLLDREKDKMAASVVQMIERAKGEKEEATRREIQQIEERFAHLLEEKKLQMQKQLQDANDVKILPATYRLQDAAIQTENPLLASSTPVGTVTQPSPPLCTSKKAKDESNEVKNESFETDSTTTLSTNVEGKTIPPSNPCQCKNLQKQIAHVEKEMEFLKSRSSSKSFRKNPPVNRSKKIPIKAIRDDWWVDESDDSTSTVSSSVTTSELPRILRGRSQSLTNLHAPKETLFSSPVHRARRLLTRNRVQKKAWMEDVSPTDLSSVETLTSSGVTSSTSPVSNFEWENVLHSIQKISGDLRQVWSHIGGGPISPHQPLRSTSYAHHSKSPLLGSSSSLPWFPLENPSIHRPPLHWPLTGSTAERTRALRQWLQQNNNKSQLF